MMPQSVGKKEGKSSPASKGFDGDGEVVIPRGYLEKSKTPFGSLLFLLPMMVLYEAGTYYFATDLRHHTETRVEAFRYMLRFFEWFGIGSKYWPPFAVAAVLIASHKLHRYPWKLDLGVTWCMALESIAWCLPLFLVDGLARSYVPLRPLEADRNSLAEMVVLSVGAGVYEELVFRLCLMSALSVVLENLFGMPKFRAIPLMVVLSATLFAWYHYQPGGEVFSLQTFAFRTAAGIYFGAIFWWRGFGVTCGTHACYDILAVVLPAFSARY